LASTREVAEEIVRATAEWPSSGAIRGLIDEYLSQGSQERRVVILLDVLDCLRQDMEAERGQSTELKALMARMSGSRWRFLGTQRPKGCTHLKRARKGAGAVGAEREVIDLLPSRQVP
jgi:hypothetical protein